MAIKKDTIIPRSTITPESEEIESISVAPIPNSNQIGMIARRLHDAGMSIIPIHQGYAKTIAIKDADGKTIRRPMTDSEGNQIIDFKSPTLKDGWEPYMTKRASLLQVEAWFGTHDSADKRYQTMNIAVVCGKVSNIIVVDTDSVEAETWVAANLPVTPMKVQTSKGFHRYYRYPETDTSFPNKIGYGGFALDIKADGGYVVCPPSLHKTGVHYTFVEIDPTSPWDWDLSKLPVYNPDWFKEFTTESDRSPSYDDVEDVHGTYIEGLSDECAIAHIKRKSAVTGSKKRKITAFQVSADVCRGFDIPKEKAWEIIKEWNITNLTPPLSEDELRHQFICGGKSGRCAIGSKNKNLGDNTCSTTDIPSLRKMDISTIQKFLIADMVKSQYVVTPGESHFIYKWDDEEKYYVSVDVEVIQRRVEQLLLTHTTKGAGKSQVKGLTEVILSQVCERTWKKEYANHQTDFISFKNGIVSRQLVKKNHYSRFPRESTPDFFCTYKLDYNWLVMDSYQNVIDKLIVPMGFMRDTDINAPLKKLEEFGRFAKSIIIGDPLHQKILCLVGESGSGKSQYVHILESLLPARHITHITMEQMGNDKDGFHTIGFKDSLLNSVSEAGYPNHKAVQLMKQISGGDAIQARRLRENPVSFRSRANQLITSNNPIGTGGDTSGAFHQRLRTINFDLKVRDTSAAVEDFGIKFMKDHGDEFVSWAMSLSGTFGQSDVFLTEDKKGIEESDFIHCAKEFFQRKRISLVRAAEIFSDKYHKISPRKMAFELTRIGWINQGRSMSDGSFTTFFSPPPGFFPEETILVEDSPLSIENDSSIVAFEVN